MANVIGVQKLIDLLKEADPTAEMVAVLTASDLTIGLNQLKPLIRIDFSKECICAIKYEDAEETGSAVAVQHVAWSGLERDYYKSKTVRRNGNFWFELAGKRYDVQSQKQLLKDGIVALEALRPGMLEKLAKIKSRVRRIVARNPSDLFDNPNLVNDRHFDKLVEGWWLGTNNNGEQVKRWLERACQCADLIWGKDFKVSLDG